MLYKLISTHLLPFDISRCIIKQIMNYGSSYDDQQIFQKALETLLKANKHKVFLSYYHYEDQTYKDRFEKIFGHLFINKSVKDGDIKEDLSTEYIKRLIREDYISDSSVLIVLVGANTHKRKHVDWEISAALEKGSGLLGLQLPQYNYSTQSLYYPPTSILPARLRANVGSKYARFYRWTEDVEQIKQHIEEAFKNKGTLGHLRTNSLPQMQYNKQ